MADIIETTEDGMVRIIFEKTDGTNNFRDALYYSQEYYNTIDPTEIETEKQRRFDNWISIITAPPVEEVVPPIIQDLPQG